MWKVAQKYTLADNFFMGGFGGSFFNHQWLICACAPLLCRTPTQSPAKPTIAAVEPDGVTLTARRQLAEVGARGHPEIRQRTAISRRTSTPSTRCSRPTSRATTRRPKGGDPALRRPGAGHHAAAADRADDRRPAEPQGRQLGLVRRRLAGRRSTTATATPVAELPVSPPAVQLLRELRAGHARRAPSTCATAGWTASSSSRRSTPARCRRSPSTSRRAISTSIRAMPTCRRATSTSPT